MTAQIGLQTMCHGALPKVEAIGPKRFLVFAGWDPRQIIPALRGSPQDAPRLGRLSPSRDVNSSLNCPIEGIYFAS